MKLVEELKDRLIENLDLSKNITDEQLREIIASMVMEQYRGKQLPLREKIRISRELFHSIRGLDILQEILEMDGITEIMVNGYDRIFIEQGGKLSRYPGQFASPAKLSDVIQSIAARANKRVNEASPILDTRLEDGSRVNIVLAPVCVGGPAVTIRRFPEKAITMDTLITMGSITTEAAQFLRLLVVNGYNLFISGGTGSGKLSLL